MSRKTLKLPEDEYDRHNERRKELGLSWAEYINGQAPEYTVDYDRIQQIVHNEVERELHELRNGR